MNGGRDAEEERSEWRRAFLYTRCVCFGCTGKDPPPQMTNFTGDDNGSTSSSMVDTNSVHRQKEKTKLRMRLPETSKMPIATPSRGLDESLRAIHVKNDFVLNDRVDQILTTLDGRSVMAGRRRQSPPLPLLPQPSGRHDDEEEEKEEEDGRALSLRGVVGTPSSSASSSAGMRGPNCLRQMHHLSLLSASRDLRVLLDLQYLTQAFRVLNSANQWSFNIFTLNKLTNGRSLFYMTLHIFNQCDFLRAFSLDVTRLMRCITLIESSYYFSNPYHNSVHAADVVQAMFCHLNEPKMANCLKPLEKMAAILSAACHDVDHPGTNQGFLIATANPLCSLYDNTSILENHHWRATIGILHESKLFEHFNRHEWETMKRLIQTMILATDITRQTEILSVFRDHLGNNSLNLSSNEEHRSFILQITLKCADISNPCRPWHLSKCWSELICEEFFKQGDSERSLHLPVTPFCDRGQSSIATIQTGFMTHVAEPLFVEWDRFSSTTNSRTLLDNLQHNRGQWKSITLRKSSQATPAAEVAEEQALTKTNSETLEQRIQVNGERPEDRRNAEEDVSDSIAPRGSFHRRYSLPAGPSIRSTGRRLSLPNGCSSVLSSVISRLARLSENAHASEDACNSVRKSKVRRCSFEDSTPDRMVLHHSKQHQMNQQRSTDYTERNNQNSQKLCMGLENSHSAHLKEIDFHTNAGCTDIGNRLELDGALPPCYVPNSCRPDSEHSRWQGARKMSLITPKDQQLMTVIVGRKRSRSLVTSTLVCTFEENRNTTSAAAAAALQSLETNLLNGLVQADATSSSWSRWMAWWHKKTKNHLCTTTNLPPGPLSADAYHCHLPGDDDNVDKILPPPPAALSSVGSGRAMPSAQLLSCECPVLVTRLVDSHCRPAKGGCSGSSNIISRKPISVFTSSSSPATEDAESMPLLAPDSSTCIWSNEM